MILIPPPVVAEMQNHAFASYPGECCGLLFAKPGSTNVTRSAPLENLADRYHALDPSEYPRTSRDAFMVNEAKLDRLVREAETFGELWIAFYHSHIDCGAYFSDEDKRFAAPNSTPVYPHLYQIVIETHADRIVEARAFRWDGADFSYQQTFPEFAGGKTIVARSIDTLSVHAGEPREKACDSLVTPLIFATAYPFANTDELHRYFRGELVRGEEYGRYGNPTQSVAEAKLAALDGGEAALLTATGMAAIVTTLLAMIRPGMHIVITSDSYRKTRVFVRDFLAGFGVEHTSCEPTVEGIAAAVRPHTKLIVTESPTNPYLNCIDLQALVTLAREKRIKTLIDATLATPFNLQPLDFGVDLVVHSATKYLGGHNDLMAGAVIGSRGLIDAIREYQGMFGALASPFTAYMLIRGLKTFAIRMRHQNESGQRVAEFLEGHPKIEQVWYPGLKSHSAYAIAKRQMRGFGALISFSVRGGIAEGSKVVDACKIPYLAPSLGGPESLIEQPALMSYYDKSPEERAAIGIRENLIRMSIGLESADDLISDLDQALSQI